MTFKHEIKTNILNGKRIVYTSETTFFVQIARQNKTYRTKYSFKGSLGLAVRWYNHINLGNGYKKRIYCPSMNNKVLARQVSF